jgi:hypothetical protein
MRLPRVRFTVRGLMIAVAVFAVSVYVAVPAWDYYSLPPGTRRVLTKLGHPIRFPAAGPIPLLGLLKIIRGASIGPKDNGIPIYVDPDGLVEAGAGIQSPVEVDSDRVPVKERLGRSLKPLGLGYFVKDGLLTITSGKSADRALKSHPKAARRP